MSRGAQRICVGVLALVAGLFVSLAHAGIALADTTPAPIVYASTFSTGAPLTLKKPTGVVPGDLLLICLVEHNGSSVSPPSGFTQEINIGSSTNREYCFYRIADGTEASSVSFSSSMTAAGVYYDIEYANTTSPFEDAETTSSSTTLPSVSPTDADTLQLSTAAAIDGSWDGTASFTTPSGWTEDGQGGLAPYPGQYSVAMEALHIERDASGATGTTSVSASCCTSAAHFGVSLDIKAEASKAPVDRALPTISFSAPLAYGSVLTAHDGDWSERPTGSTTWQWQRAEGDSGTFTDIAGATGSTYTITAADLDNAVRVVATRTNSAGEGVVASLPARVTGAPVVHSVTHASAGEGSTLTLSKPSGIATGDLLLICLAEENGSSVSPPSGFTQEISLGSSARLEYCFYRIADGTEASSISFGSSMNIAAVYWDIRYADTSNPFEDVESKGGVLPSVYALDAPTLEVSMAAAIDSGWNGVATFTPPSGWTEDADTGASGYPGQFSASIEGVHIERDGAGATGTATPVDSPGESIVGISLDIPASLAAREAPTLINAPTVSGTTQVGGTLTATTGDWTDSPSSYSYQWQTSSNGSTWTNASGTGATTSSYTPDTADAYGYLRVVVTATNSLGSTSADSSATSEVWWSAAAAAQSYGGTNPAAHGLCNICQNVGKPVNTENGDTYETTTDAHVATYGPQLTFTRTYDSLLSQSEEASSTPGPLGYGWTDNWNTSLELNAPSTGDVTVVQADGATVTFIPPSSGSCPSPYVGPGTSGTYCALPSVQATLSYDSGSSTYKFITHPYTSYTFDSTGKLTGEASPGGAQLTLSYGTPSPGSGDCPSAASSCFTVTSASGRALVIAENSSGLVTQVEDPLNRTWTYSYTSSRLSSVTDPLGHVTSFTYDTSNANSNLQADMLTETLPNGQTGGPDAGDKLVNTYNAAGQVVTQTDPGGAETSFDYSHMNVSTGDGYTLVTDPDGNESKYAYTAGALTTMTKGYGSSSPSSWTYTLDPKTLLQSSVSDPNNHTTSYTYDADGNVTARTNPLSRTWTYAYNSYDEPTCETLPLASSGCASLSPPAAITGGGTVSPPSSAPPKYATYREYDTAGNPVWTSTGDYAPGSSSASQSRTTYSLGNGESVTLAGNTDSCSASAPSTSLPCATIDANGVVTQLGYSSSGDLTSSSTPDGNAGDEQALTTFTYDGDGELLTRVAPDGNLSGADAADYTTTNTYTSDGQLHTSTVSETGGDITARETTYGYDPNGNRISIVDARGKETDYAYDANDRLTLVTDPDAHETLTCYDGDGNIAETVPAVGVAANTLTPASCPSSYPSDYGVRLAADATTYAYNALGDRTIITTPAPAGQTDHETTTNTYDPAGQLLRATAPPASNDTGASNQVTMYTYDNAGELLTRTTAYGTSAASTTSYCYDPNGDKTASVAPDGNTSSVASCSSSSPWQTSSSYQTSYTYDSLGELVSETRPATSAAPSGQTTSYTYDPSGNMLTSEDANGTTATYTYTPLNQVSGVSYSDSTPSVSYAYDANGNRVTMSDASGDSSYAYDVFDELVSATNGASQEVDYSYNADGQVTGITYPIGSPSWASSSTVSYAYDDAGLMTSVTDFDGNTISVGNTADGLPDSLGLGSTGDTVSTTYDPTDSPSAITLTDSGSSTLLGFSYSDTPSGTIASETDTPSSSVSPAAYDYDAQSRVTQMTPGSSSTLNYAFDASGNLTTLPTSASGSYDNGSELTSSTLSGTTTSYTYDAAGERIQEAQGGTTTVSASYNGAHELTSYSNDAADMSAATYDGDGLRVSETVTPAGGSAETEAFVWDTVSSNVPHLLMDTESAYIYGPGDTPIEQVSLASGEISYLVSDSLGSVRGVVDGSDGSLTASTSYDAWGNPETSGGVTAETRFGYAGGYTDPTGLVYLVHRYYDPLTGQFFSLDPRIDLSEQAYAYANGNPINEVDPLGLWGWNPIADVEQLGSDAWEVDVSVNHSVVGFLTKHELATKIAAVGVGCLAVPEACTYLVFTSGIINVAQSADQNLVQGKNPGAFAADLLINALGPAEARFVEAGFAAGGEQGLRAALAKAGFEGSLDWVLETVKNVQSVETSPGPTSCWPSVESTS